MNRSSLSGFAENSTYPDLPVKGQTAPHDRLIVPMGEISYFDTTGTSVAIAAQSDGSTNMVKINPATVLSGYEFDNGGADDGRLRYTGAKAKMFHCACSISFSGAGPNDVFVVGIAKNGTVINASRILRKMGAAGDVGSTALHQMAELATNDYLEVYAGNITDIDNFTINTLNLFAAGM